MSSISRFLPALLAGSLAFLRLAAAAAAPCGRPDVDATYPPEGAASVPTNALLAAHYASPASYADEPVSVTDSAGNPVGVTATYDDADSLLRAVPDSTFSPGSYQVDWPGLRGVSSSGGVGRGSSVSFSVTDSTDAAPPAFSGLVGVEWDLSRDRDPCLDQLDDRFVFKLKVGQATDDAGPGLLALRLFQTLDPLSPEQTEPSSLGVQPWPAAGVLEVRRPADAAGQTCFAAIAQDLVGSVSGGGEHEVCVKTKRPPFFDGCSLARTANRAPGSQAAGSAALLLLSLAWRRRNRALHARARLHG